MRIVVSFLLSLIIYISIIFLFISFIFKKQKKQEVLVHTAIVVRSKTIKNNIITPKKTITQKVKKTVAKKVNKKVTRGSRTNIETGGDVTFNDIFKNVKTNVPTTPVKLKKNSQMSRFKGIERIEKNLNKVKLLNINISYQTNSLNVKGEELNKIIEKISKVWYEISNIPGEYAKINIINNNGNISVVILSSNLDINKQKLLIDLIKNIKFDKNFDINILFQTKVNK
ncbi:hypothetical protein [Caminibacter sp.]